MDRMLSEQLLQMLINVQTAIIRSGCHGSQWREFESNILLLVRMICMVNDLPSIIMYLQCRKCDL